MPLIVYLDAQDYINLFNEEEGGVNNRILSKLLTSRTQGQIEIGYSFATIMEFITEPNDENRAERVRRGELIKDICGSNAFPYPTDTANGAKFPNGGMWMPRSATRHFSANAFRNHIAEALKQQLAKQGGLNRETRRQLARRSSLAELTRALGSTWGRKRSDWGDFPVSDEVIESRVVERFMKGECSDREFESRLGAWISSPTEYSRIFYDCLGEPNLITKIFGESISHIEQRMQEGRDICEDRKSLKAQIAETRASLIEAGLPRREVRKLTPKLPSLESMNSDIVHELERVFGTGRAGHFAHYLARFMKGQFAFERSDVMDLMQLTYAYDCDLLRCDTKMASVFKDFPPFKGKLVARFSDLPGRIKALVG